MEKAITFLNDFSDDVAAQVMEKLEKHREISLNIEENVRTRMFLRYF